MESTATLPADNIEPSTVADQALIPTSAAPLEDGTGKHHEEIKDFNDLSYDEMMKAWQEQEQRAANASEPGPTVSENVTPEVESPASVEETPAGEAVEVPEDDREGPNSYRLKVNSDTDAAIMAIMKRNPGMTIIEALSKVSPAQLPANPATEPDEAPATKVSSLDDITARQEAVKAEMQTAYEAMDFALAGQLNQESIDLIERKFKAEQEQALAASVQQQAESAKWEHYENQTEQLYPQSANPNSSLRVKMLEIHTAMKAAGDPLIDSPESTLRIAQMAAGQLAIPPATVKAAPVSAPQAVVPKPAVMRPRPQDGGTSPGSSTSSQAAALKALDRLTPDQFAEVFGGR